MAYTNEILNELFNPENVGVIKGADGVGKVVSQESGQIMKIYISLDGDTIKEATYQTFGPTVAIACCSLATKMMIGKTLEEAEKNITSKAIIKALNGIEESKQKYAVMAEETVKSAIKNVDKKIK